MLNFLKWLFQSNEPESLHSCLQVAQEIKNRTDCCDLIWRPKHYIGDPCIAITYEAFEGDTTNTSMGLQFVRGAYVSYLLIDNEELSLPKQVIKELWKSIERNLDSYYRFRQDSLARKYLDATK